ncbi:Ulp1 family isopeptidase [Bradyrhizobium sp. CB1650]|uniref:Ulp1 family isopeptidase n=1 Tax=Bradyrhizobium sp. CB1650 TaxID=3039153 RepID=UPI0024350B42|nr:Ulp1 family isopeptidase [Bradyrhizobium sp. CB1650]WGD50839.1 Ulp1 family isopeptidase [Bradyrhizobium sp. CB1650]
MNFVSMNQVGQQTNGVDAQDTSPADSSAEAAAFQRQLGEIVVPSAPVLIQVRAHQADASRSEAHAGEDEAVLGASALETAQSNWVLVGRSKEPLYATDARLISGLKQALLRGGAAESTATNNVGYLLSLSRWLFANDKPGIADRLHDESMDKDVEEFITKCGPVNVRWALAHLRTSQLTGGIVPIAGRPDPTPYPKDGTLIKEYKKQAVAAGTSSTAKTYASILTDFSHYLRANNKRGIAARLQDETWNDDEPLNEEIKRYKDAGGNKSIGAALDHLRNGARKFNGPPFHSEDAPLISGLQEALVKAGYEEITAKTNYVRPLRRFSRWLFEKNKPGVAARLNDESLSSDATIFDQSHRNLVLTALDRLRASQSPGGVASITGRTRGIAAAKQGESQPAFSWPAALAEGDDQDLFFGTVDEAGASSCLQPPRHGLALNPTESPHPVNWRHQDDELTDERYRNILMPGEQIPIMRASGHPSTPPPHGQGGGTMLNASGHAKLVFAGSSLDPVYCEDASLIEGLRPALIKAGASESTVGRNLRGLLSLGHWLVKNDKPGIASRLFDKSLDKDAQEFAEQEGQAIATPLDHLRASQSPGGIMPFASRVERNPYPQDADLIKRYKEEAPPSTANTARSYATLLIDFSDYLRENDKPGIAARLGHGSLDEDVNRYKEADPHGRSKAGAALAHLLKSPAGATAIELLRHICPLPDLEDAVRAEMKPTLSATAQHSGSNGAVSWPEILPANQQDLPLETMDGPSSSPPPQGDAVERPLMQIPSHQLATSPAQRQAPVSSPDELIGEQLPAEDAELLTRFRVHAERRKLTEGAINNGVYALRAFIRWVNASHKGPVASRLRDSSSLDAEIAQYRSSGRAPKNRIKSALDHLRRLLRGGGEAEAPEPRVLGAPRRLVPHPEDAPLIEGALSQALKDLKNPTVKLRQSAQQRARRLRALSAWLREKGKGSIIGRLNGSSREQVSLDNDVVAFQRAGGRVHGPDLSHLRSYLNLTAANRELGLPGPEQPNSPAAQGDRHSGSAQDVPSTPASPSAGAWVWLGEQLQERASPSMPSSHAKGRLEPSVGLIASTPSELHDDAGFAPSHPARVRSDTYAGLEPFVDLNAPTPSDLRDDAQFAPADPSRVRSDTYAGLEPFVDLNAPTPSELRDDAQFAPADPARVRSDTYAGLEPFVDLNAPTPSELRDDAHFAPADPARARSDTYAGSVSFVGRDAPRPQVIDLNPPTLQELRDDARSAPFPRTSDDAQIGAMDPTASSYGRSKLELGAKEWLGDKHINRDYELLAEELRRSRPELAALTQLVDPLIAHYQLRFGAEPDMLRAFQRIVYDSNGNDTADFLFLPVNDAMDPNRLGTHWSLLLLDRHTRGEPVAYHYDSVRGHNHEAAAQLARRLRARLESPNMAQQRNSYDCGVFVVDGTRALVRRLAQGERPGHELLHLDNLVANRRSLQDRLRAHPSLG